MSIGGLFSAAATAGAAYTWWLDLHMWVTYGGRLVGIITRPHCAHHTQQPYVSTTRINHTQNLVGGGATGSTVSIKYCK